MFCTYWAGLEQEPKRRRHAGEPHLLLPTPGQAGQLYRPLPAAAQDGAPAALLRTVFGQRGDRLRSSSRHIRDLSPPPPFVAATITAKRW